MKKNYYVFFAITLFLSWACQSSIKEEQAATATQEETQLPNVILIMADDQGWGDAGYNEHSEILTPTLDAMAENGILMERFYAAAPVCSPTRGSCLTGRNPFRYGIFSANVGSLPQEEITLAELLKENGYRTGHFGKWHLGTLTKDTLDANRGGKPKYQDEYSPPWQHGFDVCFSTESKVPTWDPILTPEKAAGGVGKQGLGNYFGTAYWNEKGERVTDNLHGDDSRVIMDRAIPFIENAANNKTPFFTVIWFHTPHTPVVAGEKYRDMYAGLSEEKQHYYGCITAMDEQIGRLRTRLKELGIHDNTLTFFTSDNGPENNQNRPRSIGITKGLTERKRSLKEGGIRVPGLMEYPALFPKGKSISMPVFSSDYLPTILEVVGINYPENRPLDGESILPLLQGSTAPKERKPMVFRFQEQVAVIDGDFKIYRKQKDTPFLLYDIQNDPAELNNIAEQQPDKHAALIQHWQDWEISQQKSLAGEDYSSDID